MSKNREKCGKKFIDGETYQTLACDREDRPHIVHHDSKTGTKAVRVPGGAYITKPPKG
jgi:hypothetical protein